jgi:hypothetical protein
MQNRSAKYSLIWQVFLFLVCACLFGAVFSVISAFGHLSTGLTGPGNDIFADSIKQGLAELPITSSLFGSVRVAAWPELFQNYLYHNPYINHHLAPNLNISVYAQTPLAELQLQAIAKVIVLFNPYIALLILTGIYILLLLLVKTVWEIEVGKNHADSWTLFAIALCCYPSALVLIRGNFHAGYATVGTILYVLTRYSSRFRWLGALGLAIAINLRPNIAVFALLEFACNQGAFKALGQDIILGLWAMAILGISLLLAHSIDPNYSLGAFFQAYHDFTVSYVYNDWGLQGNVSLYGGVRAFWHMLGIAPSYNPIAADIIAGIGYVFVVCFVLGAMKAKWSLIEGAFLVCAFCTMFTPVYNPYHMQKFLIPVFVLFSKLVISRKGGNLLQCWPLFPLIFLFSLPAWLYPSGITATLLIIGCLIALRGCWLVAPQLGGDTRTEGFAVVLSLLMLCPLGPGVTMQVAISTLLLGSTSILMLKCSRSPDGTQKILASGAPEKSQPISFP